MTGLAATVISAVWRVRTSGGFTRRANSVWPHAFGQRLDLDTKLANVERHYASCGLPAVFQVGPAAQPKTLDRALAQRDYRLSGDVEVRTARLSDLAGADIPPSSGVGLLDQPAPRWLEAWARASGHRPGAPELAARILARVRAPSAYALLRVGGDDIAVARGILDGGWLGVDDVVTAPAMRRRGAARLLLAALVSWGARRGAEQAWVAVAADNEPAIALCRAVGLPSVRLMADLFHADLHEADHRHEHPQVPEPARGEPRADAPGAPGPERDADHEHRRRERGRDLGNRHRKPGSDVDRLSHRVGPQQGRADRERRCR